MTLEKYQKLIEKTAIYPSNKGVEYCVFGLCGESGEVAEKFKKLIRDKGGEITPEFKKAIGKELGDVAWYITALGRELGFTLEEILELNSKKLNKRLDTDTLHGEGDNREEQ